jgi:hypothetical protein
MALIRQALVLRAQAEQKAGAERKALLEAALGKYMAVFYGSNLLPGESGDTFWVEKAGRDMADMLMEPSEVHNLGQARNVCDRLKKLLPMLARSLDEKIARLNQARERAGP